MSEPMTEAAKDDVIARSIARIADPFARILIEALWKNAVDADEVRAIIHADRLATAQEHSDLVRRLAQDGGADA